MSIRIGDIYEQRYRVDAFIASGGMGAVYRVWDLEQKTPLAMKVMHGDLADDPIGYKRFQKEARSLQKLNHSNIVPFYGLYQTIDFFFILEKFIDGPTLKSRLKIENGKPLPYLEALVYTKAVCAALSYAHSNKIIHCDIKPGNVLIDQAGKIYITDFGIARTSDVTTSTNIGTGTPAYMAPEQIRGEAVSPATDLYSLAVMTFELMTGSRPFRGTDAETGSTSQSTAERIRYAHLHMPPPTPQQINPNLPEKFNRFIQIAMAKDPAARYPDAWQFFTALCDCFNLSPDLIPDSVTLPGHFHGNEPQTVPNREFTSNTATNDLLSGTPTSILEEGENRPTISAPPSKRGLLVVAALGIVAVVALGGFFLFNPPDSFPSNSASTGNSHSSGSSNPAQEASATSPVQEKSSSNSSTTAATKTPAKSSSTPRSVTLYYPLSDCNAASRIHIGDWVVVNQASGGNYIREYADTHPSDNIIDTAEVGESMIVLSGPVCNYGWLLWEVQTTNGVRGWTAETDGNAFWLDLLDEDSGDSSMVCSDTAPSRLHVGGRAMVNDDPPVSNRVRSEASTDSERVGSIDPGEGMDILDGPRCSEGILWWKVEADSSGLIGWTAEAVGYDYYLTPLP